MNLLPVRTSVLLLLSLLLLSTSAGAALVAHWPLSSDGNDVSGNNHHLTLRNGATIVNAAGQFIIGTGALGGTDALGALNGTSEDAIANGGSGGTPFQGFSGATPRTIVLWAKGLAQTEAFGTLVSMGPGGTPNGARYDLRVIGEAAPTGRIRVEVNGGGLNQSFSDVPPIITDTNWHSVVAVLSSPGDNLDHVTLYVDGRQLVTVKQGNPALSTQATLPVAIGNSILEDAGGPFDRNFRGWIDDVGIFSDANLGNASVSVPASVAIHHAMGRLGGLGLEALPTAQNIWLTGTPASIDGITWYKLAGLTGDLGDYGGSVAGGTAFVVLDNDGNGIGTAGQPVVNVQPESQTNAVGTAAQFVVDGAGASPLFFQWFFNGSAVPGATAKTLNRDPVALSHDGEYFATISNSVGVATSQVATLTVVEDLPPAITQQPIGDEVNLGDPVTFTVTAGGSPPLAYQWRQNGFPIGGAIFSTYNIPSATYASEGNYDVVITNALGSVTSVVVFLSVLDETPPVIGGVSNITVAAESPAGTVVNFSLTGFDDRDGTVAVDTDSPSGSVFAPGVTMVKATAIDAAGNEAEAFFYVWVESAGRMQTLLNDPFTVSAPSSNINLQVSTRQSGLVAPIPFAELLRTDSRGRFAHITQVGNPTQPGKLLLNPDSASSAQAFAMPAREFVEGSAFEIEVTIEQSIGGAKSNEWAGIAWGSAGNLNFPNDTQGGMGLLVRGNGQIAVYDGTATVYEGPPDYLSAGGPAPTNAPFTLRIEVIGSGFGNDEPAFVKAFINNEQIRLAPDSLDYTKSSGFSGNFITLAGSALEGVTSHTLDNLEVRALPSIFASAPHLAIESGASAQTFTVTVPPAWVATNSVNVILSNSNPAAAQMAGEAAGSLTLDFPMGGGHQQTVSVTALAEGETVLSLSSDAPLPIGGRPVTVAVRDPSPHIANGSFEPEPLPPFPGYGAIPGWTAFDTNWVGVSRNVNVGGVIANQGNSRDGRNVAFLRADNLSFAGLQDISTTITSLNPGQKYELRFDANNMRGSGSDAFMRVYIDGFPEKLFTRVNTVPGVAPYRPVGINFTPSSSSASLMIENETFNDNALLFDNIQVLEVPEVGGWAQAPWTSDADSGIVGTGLYTHAYSLGDSDDVTVDGITFTAVPGFFPAVPGAFSLTGGGGQAINPNSRNNVFGDSRALGNGFVYGGDNPVLTLEGLNPGAIYQLTLFSGGFGPASDFLGFRVMTFEGSSGYRRTVDQNLYGDAAGVRVDYIFEAVDSIEQVTWRTMRDGFTYHFWAFANRELEPAPPPPADVGLQILLQGGVPTVVWSNGVGVLQSSTNLPAGAWTDIPAATPPYPVAAPKTMEAFRVRE